MLRKCIRLALLLAAVIASFHVTAATRYWTLTGVQFDDGAVATGYFGYDDVTNKLTQWNIRVSRGPLFLAFTYTPGNSHALVAGNGIDLWSYHDKFRTVGVGSRIPLDGSNSTTSVTPATGSEAFGYWIFAGEFEIQGTRTIVAGSLASTPLPPPVAIVQVDEFYHPGLRHYFITADSAEKLALDPVVGVHRGWVRTGESFKAYATGTGPVGSRRTPESVYPGSVNPVCRYYGMPGLRLDSHFYSGSGQECEAVYAVFRGWLFESDNVFEIEVPGPTGCPVGTLPVYRLWNQREDSNHRYTTKAAIAAQMILEGYLGEAVVMCAVQ